MRAAARFQRHLDRRQPFKKSQQLTPPQIAPQHRSAGGIDPMQREHRLGRVDGDAFNLGHGRSPVRVSTTELWHQMPRGRPPQRKSRRRIPPKPVGAREVGGLRCAHPPYASLPK
jgi:hypothetical protein